MPVTSTTLGGLADGVCSSLDQHQALVARSSTPREGCQNRFPGVTMSVVISLSTACHCEQADSRETDPVGSTSDTSTGAPSSTSESGFGEPFDAASWIGRFHYEDPALPFGELGAPYGPGMLVNFEIFADMRAVFVYDDCSFEDPIVIHYVWEPDEDDGLRLRPGAGEASLRYGALEDLESLRVTRTEPVGSCRPQLSFEYDGLLDTFSRFYPGESCWVIRCTVPNLIQVDYCEGEEPPPCP